MTLDGLVSLIHQIRVCMAWHFLPVNSIHILNVFIDQTMFRPIFQKSMQRMTGYNRFLTLSDSKMNQVLPFTFGTDDEARQIAQLF